MNVEKAQPSNIICVSGVNDVSGNANLNYQGGGTVDARTKENHSVWDNEW